MSYASAIWAEGARSLGGEELLQTFIVTNIVTLTILYLVTRRMLKLRRQKNRSFNLRQYPISKVDLSSVAPCFSINEYGITANSAVSFIGS